MKDDSSSLSFLNFNWCETGTDTSMVYPFILDPSFMDYYIEVSHRLQDLIKKNKKINFSYKIINEDVIRIVNIKTKNVLLELGVCDFEKIEFINVHRSKIFLVLNRNKFRKKIVSRNNKIYKQNVEKSSTTAIENEYEALQNFLFRTQINYKINFIFIDGEEVLFRELKNILKFCISDNKYVPKIKTFKVGKETEYLEYILSKIPGISKCVAKNVAEKYRTISKLQKELEKGNERDLSEMLIEDKENNKFRRLGVPQTNKILQVFRSENPEDKLI
ncbi:hypothetical protein P3W45_000562 [Vairimorpha bombi]|jgi:hypothetical protein